MDVGCLENISSNAGLASPQGTHPVLVNNSAKTVLGAAEREDAKMKIRVNEKAVRVHIFLFVEGFLRKWGILKVQGTQKAKAESLLKGEVSAVGSISGIPLLDWGYILVASAKSHRSDR